MALSVLLVIATATVASAWATAPTASDRWVNFDVWESNAGRWTFFADPWAVGLVRGLYPDTRRMDDAAQAAWIADRRRIDQRLLGFLFWRRRVGIITAVGGSAGSGPGRGSPMSGMDCAVVTAVGVPASPSAAVLGGYPALVFWWAVRRRRRRRSGRCVPCGYDLRSTGGRCPECGSVRLVQ